MATAIQASVGKLGAYGAGASLAAAVVFHAIKLEGFAEFFGNAAFFLLVLAVIFVRE